MLLNDQQVRLEGAGELDAASLDRLFREARTRSAWLDRAVAEGTLRPIYDLMKYGPSPTSGTATRPDCVSAAPTRAEEAVRVL